MSGSKSGSEFVLRDPTTVAVEPATVDSLKRIKEETDARNMNEVILLLVSLFWEDEKT